MLCEHYLYSIKLNLNNKQIKKNPHFVEKIYFIGNRYPSLSLNNKI